MIIFNSNFIYLITTMSFKDWLTLFYLLLGIVLCIAEFLLPKNIAQKYRYIALMTGIGSLLVWLQMWRKLAITNYLTDGLLVVYWGVICFSLVVWIRPIFFRSKTNKIKEADEAKTLTEILPGKMGKVLYEGGTWSALCKNCNEVISVNQKVYVIGREGNTLIIAPQDFFEIKN